MLTDQVMDKMNGIPEGGPEQWRDGDMGHAGLCGKRGCMNTSMRDGWVVILRDCDWGILAGSF